MRLSLLSSTLCLGTALASRCKPSYPLSASHVATTTRPVEPSTSTSISVPSSLEAVSYDTTATRASTSTTEIMSSSAESVEPSESTTSVAAVSSTEVLSSTVVISSTEAAVSSLTTIITEVLPSTTSASTSADATTTSTPAQPTNITGFCLKLSSTTPQLQNLIMTSGSPVSNHLVQPVGVPNFSLFNIDTRTGVLTMNNTNPGFVVMAPPPFSSQTMRVLRHYPPTGDETGEASAPLICNDPSGRYTSGSVFSCSATSVFEPVTSVFNTFRTSTLAGVFAMQLFREDQGGAFRFVYQLAMFFGDECTTRM
ncbi:hypothetical protein F5X68DRAFT_279840 [Plectosphaerella plurivora]|uniref:Uncharacterized protein n=1 Tax=Plectosphaerella plurivora TaxID=936078 RepID=A0A9P9A3E3_9PEZI|nr:hypothetical protein F5X68DRAFT_279840 [Plectosphaerella plurivora]